MYAVQSAGCAPIVRAWSEGKAEAATWTRADTEAWGLRVPAARGDFLILRVLRDTTGGAIAVTDDDMRAGSSELGAREGINAIIEGGASLAAARALRRAGELADGELVVLFNTGNMLAY
jgi:threonine synthase